MIAAKCHNCRNCQRHKPARTQILDPGLSGSDVAVSAARPDGARIDIMRQQQTPEETIEAIGKATNPLPRIIS